MSFISFKHLVGWEWGRVGLGDSQSICWVYLEISVQVLGTHDSACFRHFPAPAHPAQLTGPQSSADLDDQLKVIWSFQSGVLEQGNLLTNVRTTSLRQKHLFIGASMVELRCCCSHKICDKTVQKYKTLMDGWMTKKKTDWCKRLFSCCDKKTAAQIWMIHLLLFFIFPLIKRSSGPGFTFSSETFDTGPQRFSHLLKDSLFSQSVFTAGYM